MSTARVILLQPAVKNIASDRCFVSRWTGVATLETAIKARYHLDDSINVTKTNIHRALNKLDHSIDVAHVKHTSGVYRTNHLNDKFYFFQDPLDNPPKYPTTVGNYAVWERIKKIDEKELKDYLYCLSIKQNRQRSVKKPPAMDEVDRHIRLDEIKKLTESRSNKKS